jgi:xanthine dehydrogenase accessory factor
MPTTLTHFLVPLRTKEAQNAINAALVRIESVAGSTPRDAGTVMVVTPDAVAGTIGGGRLEWDAIAAARTMLQQDGTRLTMNIVLGPAIGQCCGGRLTLHIERLDDALLETLIAQEASIQHHAVLIYGAGHVGRALARALSVLPFDVSLIDSRSAELALFAANGVTLVHTEKPLSVAENAASGSAHVIMTHSHAVDSLIAAAVLEQDHFGYLGIIGSRTKRNSFRKAFREIGIPADRIARVVCPIGGNRVRDKRPEVIAALVAAEIIETMLG